MSWRHSLVWFDSSNGSKLRCVMSVSGWKGIFSWRASLTSVNTLRLSCLPSIPTTWKRKKITVRIKKSDIQVETSRDTKVEFDQHICFRWRARDIRRPGKKLDMYIGVWPCKRLLTHSSSFSPLKKDSLVGLSSSSPHDLLQLFPPAKEPINLWFVEASFLWTFN